MCPTVLDPTINTGFLLSEAYNLVFTRILWEVGSNRRVAWNIATNFTKLLIAPLLSSCNCEYCLILCFVLSCVDLLRIESSLGVNFCYRLGLLSVWIVRILGIPVENKLRNTIVMLLFGVVVINHILILIPGLQRIVALPRTVRIILRINGRLWRLSFGMWIRGGIISMLITGYTSKVK